MLPEGGFGLLPVVDTPRQQIEGFSSGKPHLDSFLHDSAASMHTLRLGLTTVVLHEQHPGVAIAFFTLANDATPLRTSECFDLGLDGHSLSAFPAVKLGRLAVASAFQGGGIGRQVMDLVLGEILDSESLSAARFIVVDPDDDERVVRFYESLGFEKSLWAEARRTAQKGATATAVKMHRDILRALQE